MLHLCESNMQKRKMLKILFGATIITSIALLFHLGINLQSVKKLKEIENTTTTIILDDVHISVETSHPNYKLKTPNTLTTWVPLEKEQSTVKLKEMENTSTLTLDDVYISVKTSHRNYKSRMPIILKTWVPLAKEQTWFFTDNDDEEFQRMTDGHAINTKCGPTHSPHDLSCKMGVEINTYMTTNKTWFCHFDDDNYVNVPKLVDLLKGYNAQGDWYLGKPSLTYRYSVYQKKQKERVNFWFGTGNAGICISEPLMMKMKPFTVAKEFMAAAANIQNNDDVAIGYIIEHLLNTSMTVINQFHSHYENLTLVNRTTLEEQVSFCYKNTNIIDVEGFDKKRDPTRFLSLHCILFPNTDYCSEMKSTPKL